MVSIENDGFELHDEEADTSVGDIVSVFIAAVSWPVSLHQ